MKIVCLTILLCCSLNSLLFSQWYQQSVPVNNPIVGLEFVDSLRGLVATSSYQDTSYILITTNGGINWNIQLRITGVDFEVMDAVDSTVIYVGGYRYSGPPRTVLLKTTNGGLNWLDMNMTVSNGFDDMFFVNRDSGYMCENTFLDLYRTTNGGVNWERKVNGITSFPFKLFFLNYSSGYCGGDFTLFRTTNSGDNWIALFGFSAIVKSIFFLNENTGWAGLANNRLAHTTDGGLNWSYQLPAFSVGSTTDLYFYNNSLGWGGTKLKWRIFL